MKVALIADLHIHSFPSFDEPVALDGHSVSSRALGCVEALSWALDVSRDVKCDEAWILGDLFHKGGNIDPVLINLVKEVLHTAAQFGPPIRIVTGNHDGNVGSKYTSPNIFSPMVKEIIWQPKLVEVDTLTVFFAPWFTKRGDLKPAQLLAGHLPVEGAVTGPLEYAPQTGWPRSAFDDYELTLLGHYHKPQRVTDTVRYTGALLGHTFSDTDKGDRGFFVLHTDQMALEYVKNDVSPQFVTLSSDEVEEAEVGNCYVQVKVNRTDDVNQLRGVLEEKGAVGVKCVRDSTVQKMSPRLEAVGEKQPFTAVVDEYVEGYGPDELDHDKLVKVGLEMRRRNQGGQV